LKSTLAWRKAYDNPRLADDGGPVQEVIEDILGTKLTTNLILGPWMFGADSNIQIGCEVEGIRSHYVIHSARMGYVLGDLIKKRFDKASIASLRSLTIPSDSDVGSPLSLAAYARWWKRHKSGMVFAGWTLRHIKLTSLKGDWDEFSKPDMMFISTIIGTGKERSVSPVSNKMVANWKPFIFVPKGSYLKLDVWESDVIFDNKMGVFRVGRAGKFLPKMTDKSSALGLEMSLSKTHY
jgi:hypothetical protein